MSVRFTGVTHEVVVYSINLHGKEEGTPAWKARGMALQFKVPTTSLSHPDSTCREIDSCTGHAAVV